MLAIHAGIRTYYALEFAVYTVYNDFIQAIFIVDFVIICTY